MTAVKINAFGGTVPAVDARLLSDQAAVLSENTWLYDGSLAGLIAPTYVRTLTSSTAAKVYRIPNSYFDSTYFTDATWMEFEDLDTDVVRSPIVGDTYDRYYWASSSAAPRVNSLSRIQAASASYVLGVPQPGTPTLGIAGGVSGTNRSTAYVITHVTAFGEEGPPSTPVLGTDRVDATWTITLSAPSGGDITTYNLAYANIYRTVTSGAGVATYFYVGQVAVAVTTYADTATDAVVSANDELPSTGWIAPPTDLEGWVTLPNGMIAGWRESEIWFSEPYRPHAWPAAYALSVEYPIVGLGTINQTLVVLTAGYPMVATGLNPSSMALSKLAALEPCLSRGSIISSPEGVYYASPNGLILVANGGASNVTLGLVAKDEWNRLSNVPTLRATRLASAYFAFGSSRPGFTQTDAWQTTTAGGGQIAVQLEDFTGAYSGVIIDPTNQRVAFNTLTSVLPTTNVFLDAWSGDPMIIRGGMLYRLDLADQTSDRDTFIWRSKMFQTPDKKNFGAMRVYFTVPVWAPTQSATRITSEPQTLAADQYGLVRVYADERLVMTRELRTSGEVMRLPSGFKADYWQIEFEAAVKITSVQMATSVKELLKT